MKTKDKDRSHFNEDDRGSYATHFLKLNDKKDGTCDDRKGIKDKYRSRWTNVDDYNLSLHTLIRQFKQSKEKTAKFR
eukprot:6593445-Heterocapsa_arctica.AAC.1